MISSVAGALTRGIAPLAVAAIAFSGGLATTVSSGIPTVPAPAMRLVDDSNPLAGRPFYVDPISSAMLAAKNNPSSPELQRVANTPASFWLDDAFQGGRATSTVSRYAGAAAAAGAMPVFTLYAIPHRDCGSYMAGGFGSAGAYKGWVDAVAAGLGSMPAAIILEPDALAMAGCLSADQQQERFDLMSYAVDALSRDPAAVVYVDAGHSRWTAADVMASRLQQAGVAKARGFSLNTANFFTTDEEIGYGEAISGMTGGAHYVIDTSRNGAGPATGVALDWCNPPGRALGAAPTTATAGEHADAYLWVKRPGESDGSCNAGDAPGGRFVNELAIALVRNGG